MSLDANKKNRNKCIPNTNIFSFGERILPEYRTHDVELSNSLARPVKLGCVFNKVSIVNHWRHVLNFSY